MIIATAGHVDHGKSSLVKNLTNTDPDRLEEEKIRGLTIDLGFAYSEIESTTLGFIDVPGHSKFIHNMLAGISIIDMALLIVAADDGPMPQTREHLNILQILEIDHLTIVMTRIDRCSREKLETSIQQTRDLVERRFPGTIEFFCVSNATGDGINELTSYLLHSAQLLKKRKPNGAFRLAIDRSFNIKGSGVVVTGSVFSGSISTGDEVCILPFNTKAKIRSLRCQNKPAQRAQAGDRCAINLSGMDVNATSIHRGNWVTAAEQQSPSSRVDTRINLLDSAGAIIKHGTRVHFHSAANHVMAHAYPIDCRILEAGDSNLVEFRLKEEINLWWGDRVVIRDESGEHTLGGGFVIDAAPLTKPSNKSLRIHRLHHLEKKEITAYVESHPEGLFFSRLTKTLNLDNQESVQQLNNSELMSFSVSDDTYVIACKKWMALSAQLLTFMADWHKKHPDQPGINYRQLMQTLHTDLPQSVYAQLIDELIQDGKLIRKGNLLHLPGISAQLGDSEELLWRKLGPLLKKDSTRPPVLHELAETLSIDVRTIHEAIPSLIQAGLVWRPVKNRVFIPEARNQMEKWIRELTEQSSEGHFTAADFRDLTGIGRNLAIELLEYFDSQGYTLRIGNERKLK